MDHELSPQHSWMGCASAATGIAIAAHAAASVAPLAPFIPLAPLAAATAVVPLAAARPPPYEPIHDLYLC